MRPVLAFSLLALTPALAAQQLIDRFDYADGAVPNWTVRTGGFKVQNKQLVATGGASWQYITRNGPKDVANCVLDIDVIYPAARNLYFGGVTARHDGAGGTGLVMFKIQDNAVGGTGAFNRCFLYERPGSSLWRDIVPPTKQATGRMIIKDKQGWFQVDGNMDGYFELSSPAKPFTNASTKPKGLVGANGYNAVAMDNWKYYDGIVMAAAGSTPKIGTTYTMTLYAPLREAGGRQLPTPWLAMASLGKAGIPLPDGRAVPLSVDALWVASFGFGWTGVLTTQAPDAKFSLVIPNEKGLVGLTIFTSAVTLGDTKALGIGAISNDHGFKLEG